jgi:hypothetical protein
VISGVRRNLVWGGGCHKWKCIIFKPYSLLLPIQKKKKKNAIKTEFHSSGFYTKFINYLFSIMSRCMFTSTNPFNRGCPIVFLKHVFKRLRLKKKKPHVGIYPPLPPLTCARHWKWQVYTTQTSFNAKSRFEKS